jgi:hypothetical protein
MLADKLPPAPSVDQVRQFWNSNPLFSGESRHVRLPFMIYANVRKR